MTEFSFWRELRPILGSLFYSDEIGMLKANSNDTYQPPSLIILLVSFCLVSDASVFEVSSPPSFLSLWRMFEAAEELARFFLYSKEA